MILKPALEPMEMQACIELMRKGLQSALDGNDPETAIAAYMRVVQAFSTAERVEESQPVPPQAKRGKRPA